ncbi:MAG TPA: hypothetical protein VE954_02185 [Oligoflexus sp.]|uniref:hypothetical protein n=1 Tax=Oligoflexus sp. TaxID=1971216 RepID=UPI002D30C69D|nr:hypothetical protein [Oligoflexus sp.]HYX31895.1 hypothetical protein [Oligoflexus sp.]
MLKVCKNCDLEKDEREFFISLKTGRLEDFCKSCKRELKKSESAQSWEKTRKRKELPEKFHLREQLDS